MPDQFASLICSFIFFCSFRNAYNQRKVAMFVREGEKYKEIFVQNPRTKKMECILSYPKEAWSSVWNRFYSQRSWGFEDQRNLEWSWNSYLLEDFYQNPCVDLIYFFHFNKSILFELVLSSVHNHCNVSQKFIIYCIDFF